MSAIFNVIAKRRVYILATVIYLGFSALIAIPYIQRNMVKSEVQHQLIAYRTGLPKNAVANSIVAPTISGTPTIFSINRLGITFPISRGYYNSLTSTWTLSSSYIYIDATSNPNPQISTASTSSAFFYGHNFNNVLGKTTELVPGDILTIQTSNGYLFRYYYVHDATVPPSNVSVLDTNGYPVALMTCTGLWDQDRRVMYFNALGQPTEISASKGMTQS